MPAEFLFAFRGTVRDGAVVHAHAHPFWQFELVLAGHAQAHIGADGFSLSAGDALLIAPDTPHRFVWKSGIDVVSVKFSAPSGFVPRDPLLPMGAELRALADAITALIPPGGEPPLGYRPVLGHCLAALLALTAHEPPAPLPTGLIGRVQQMIARDDAKAWTVSGIATALGLSPNYCSARFRAETGKSLKPWLDAARAAAAKRLLASSDLAIGEIAAATAFPDVFTFSRFFARLAGMSPRAWRARHAGR
jgi:AraC-like DNA-binding protein